MHKHNCCTCNGNNLNLFIKTGNGHKERMLPQTIVNTFKECEGGGIETQSKMIVAAKWRLFLQLQKQTI